MSKTVTMTDIADVFGVSTVTVSKALADKEGVSEELREQIKQKADEMGYKYGASKQKKGKPNQKFNIGVIVASNYVDLAVHSFYLNLYQNVIVALAQTGYSGIMEIITDDMKGKLILPNVVQMNKVDGIIVLGQLPANYVNNIMDYGMPVVLLDFYDNNIKTDSVLTDNFFENYQLTDHIIKNGHRKIAFVGSIHATSSILDRYLGYVRALIENNIELREDYIIEDRGLDQLTYTEMVLPEDMPTAFVCNCDEVAYLLIDQLKKKGYKVPEDVSVAGFDNYYTLLEYASMKLTTVAVDVEGMAKQAVKLIIKKIESETQSNIRRVVNGKLIIRESVRKIQ